MANMEEVTLEVCVLLKEALRRKDLHGHAHGEQNELRTMRTTKRMRSPTVRADRCLPEGRYKDGKRTGKGDSEEMLTQGLDGEEEPRGDVRRRRGSR
jgi:hypothetical protein